MNNKKVIIFIIVLMLILISCREKYFVEKEFIAQKGEYFEIVDKNSSKKLFDTNGKMILGIRNTFLYNKNTLIVNLLDGIYIYNLIDKKLKLFLSEPLICIGVSSSNDLLVVAKEGKLLLTDFKIKKNIIIDDFGYFKFEKLPIENITFISKDKFIYLAKRNDSSEAVILYDIKNKSFKRLFRLEKVGCIPKLYLENNQILCSSKKKKNNFFIINLNGKFIRNIQLNPYGNYLLYDKDKKAILYTKISLSLKGEQFTTRIYFIDSKKDYLWSKSYLQPIFE